MHFSSDNAIFLSAIRFRPRITLQQCQYQYLLHQQFIENYLNLPYFHSISKKDLIFSIF
jgi:hypothetical protein